MMVAHSAPIHSLRCCPAAEHFFATKEREGEPSEQEWERGRRVGGGGGKKELIWTPIGSANVGQTWSDVK